MKSINVTDLGRLKNEFNKHKNGLEARARELQALEMREFYFEKFFKGRDT